MNCISGSWTEYTQLCRFVLTKQLFTTGLGLTTNTRNFQATVPMGFELVYFSGVSFFWISVLGVCSVRTEFRTQVWGVWFSQLLFANFGSSAVGME